MHKLFNLLPADTALALTYIMHFFNKLVIYKLVVFLQLCLFGLDLPELL